MTEPILKLSGKTITVPVDRDFTDWEGLKAAYKTAYAEWAELEKALKAAKKTVPMQTLCRYYVTRFNALALDLYIYRRGGDALLPNTMKKNAYERLSYMRMEVDNTLRVLGRYDGYTEIDWTFRGYYKWQATDGKPENTMQYSQEDLKNLVWFR